MRLMDVLVLLAAGHFASQLHFNTSLDMASPVHTVLLYFSSGLAFFIIPTIRSVCIMAWTTYAQHVRTARGHFGAGFFLIGVFFSAS
ncbi:hypothetical protein ACFS07_02665 [Undibacterium arcticum]